MEHYIDKGLNMSFEQLFQHIIDVDHQAQVSAVKAVNKMATLRNWIIGAYIIEYEALRIRNSIVRCSKNHVHSITSILL